MNSQFWIDRWSKKEIGFHQHSINEHLQRYWQSIAAPSGSAAFVPLCGKSLDMHWLRERGHPVIGVEVAREAVADFFREWGVEAEITQAGKFERWRAHDVTVLCGDFFDLTSQDLAGVYGVFDRAALIALPESLRAAYAQKLRDVLPGGARILLVSLDYPSHEMSGPPFSVTEREVRALFAGASIELLGESDITDLPDNARFRQRGVSSLVEQVYRIR